MLSVCFRLDDPPTEDTSVEKRILEIFAEHRIVIDVSIVPCRQQLDGSPSFLDENNAAHLIDASAKGLINIYQHGYAHINRNKQTDKQSEFFGLTKHKQSQLITEGSLHLKKFFKQQIRGFVPPWNTFDLNTVRSLMDIGIDMMSTNTANLMDDCSFPIIPGTCILRNSEAQINHAMRFEAFDPVIVIVIHPDDFEEYSCLAYPDGDAKFTNLHELITFLTKIKNRRNIRFQSIYEIANEVRNGTPFTYLNNIYWWKNFVPYKIKQFTPNDLPVRRRMREIIWGCFLQSFQRDLSEQYPIK